MKTPTLRKSLKYRSKVWTQTVQNLNLQDGNTSKFQLYFVEYLEKNHFYFAKTGMRTTNVVKWFHLTRRTFFKTQSLYYFLFFIFSHLKGFSTLFPLQIWKLILLSSLRSFFSNLKIQNKPRYTLLLSAALLPGYAAKRYMSEPRISLCKGWWFSAGQMCCWQDSLKIHSCNNNCPHKLQWMLIWMWHACKPWTLQTVKSWALWTLMFDQSSTHSAAHFALFLSMILNPLHPPHPPHP